MDKFLLFSLSIEDQAFVEKYRSPKNEASYLKKVPLGQLEHAKDILRKIGIKPRIMYRGPRYNGSYSTNKRHAHSASLYDTYTRY